MKVRADENVAPGIIDVLEQFLDVAPIELSTVLGSGQRGSDDVSWITEFAAQGGKAIITGDTDFHKKPNQIVAINRTGLCVIYLPPKWTQAELHEQAAHVMVWWSRIRDKLMSSKPREVWATVWDIKTTTQLDKIKVDFAKADRKVKKDGRRNR